MSAPTRNDLRAMTAGRKHTPFTRRVSDAEVWEMMLWEDCETCARLDDGRNDECGDCDGTGRRLRGGVERYAVCCDECHEANPRYVVSVEMVEGETDDE